MPKLWFYIAFTLAWSHYVFNNWSTTEKISVVGFVSSMLTPIAVALGLILSDSLTKHQEAIRLYDVYTGDIVAFAMEILAFVENAGYKDAQKENSLESAEAIVRWKLNNLSANNYSRDSSSIDSVREQAVELLRVLEDFDTHRRAALLRNHKYTWKTFWTTFLQVSNTKYPKNVDFFNKPEVDMSIPQTLTKEINRKFKIRNVPGQVWNQLPLLANVVNQETQPWLNDPVLARQNFLLSMERIFQTLYVLPQVAKLELRDAISTSNKFNTDILKTMNVRYCNLSRNNPTIPFRKSRIVDPYTKIKDVTTKLNGDKGLTFTQLFLQTLLDYVNELHRTVGGETQTRRTLSTAWRRLYGTYGDMVTVKTYKLPRIISITMEIALVFSSLLLPFSQIDSFVERTNAIVICIAVQVVFVGLFVGVETVRNPFVATENAIGFANVSKAAKAAQEGVRELWFVRGVIQQVDPVSLDFNCVESGVTTPVQQAQQAVNVVLPKKKKKSPRVIVSEQTKLMDNKDQRMSYNGIHF
jgi:hypothetical protein